jgi:heme/copper-type cytochrome/quinol oxidase subunit 2
MDNWVELCIILIGGVIILPLLGMIVYGVVEYCREKKTIPTERKKIS